MLLGHDELDLVFGTDRHEQAAQVNPANGRTIGMSTLMLRRTLCAIS